MNKQVHKSQVIKAERYESQQSSVIFHSTRKTIQSSVDSQTPVFLWGSVQVCIPAGRAPVIQQHCHTRKPSVQQHCNTTLTHLKTLRAITAVTHENALCFNSCHTQKYSIL